MSPVMSGGSCPPSCRAGLVPRHVGRGLVPRLRRHATPFSFAVFPLEVPVDLGEYSRVDDKQVGIMDSEDKAPSPTGRERRKAQRIQINLEVDYTCEDTFLFAYITDMSASLT